MFCRVFVQYHVDRSLPYHLVEADISNPDVASVYASTERRSDGRLYRHCTYVSFEHSERKRYNPDIILDLAIECPVIVNLPAQAFHPVNRWLQRGEVLRLAYEHQVRFCKWFLCNGRQDSISLFRESLTHFDRTLDHILVLNCYFRREWAPLLRQVDPLFDKYPFSTLYLPKLADYERDWIDEQGVRFDAAMSSQLPILSRQRIHRFLKQIYYELDQGFSYV